MLKLIIEIRKVINFNLCLSFYVFFYSLAIVYSIMDSYFQFYHQIGMAISITGLVYLLPLAFGAITLVLKRSRFS
ncbi:MAG: hypothetical protein NTX82_00865 [Candidatus Parcubacteria bacterium]|nr:hypothetical protein [Candidatus Parcubacteria bacterium]